MAAKEDERRDEETIDALELLGDSAGPTGAPPPPPAKPGAASPPRSPGAPTTAPARLTGGRPAGSRRPPKDGDGALRCLHCGYRLMASSEYRCSECGRANSLEALNRWFDGEEAGRFDRLIWLLGAGLFLKLWVFPGLQTIARLGTALVVMGLHGVVVGGRQNTIGAYYAIAGIVVGLLMLFQTGSGGESTAAYYTLETVGACLLIFGLFYDPDEPDVWGARGARRIWFSVLFIAPLAAAGWWAMNQQLLIVAKRAVDAEQEPGATIGAIYQRMNFVVPHVLALAVWACVLLAVYRARRALFHSTEEAEGE